MKLHIGNLPRNVSHAELSEMITPIAKITALEIAIDETGLSRGYGYADFATDADGRRVIAAWDGREVGGHALKVGEVKPAAPPRAGGGRATTTHLRVTTRAKTDTTSKVSVTDTSVRETAGRLLATSLVSSEISYVRRVLGSSATQEALDAEVLAVRALSWSEIVKAEVADRGSLRRRG